MKQILVLAGDVDKNLGDKGIISSMCDEFIMNNNDITIGIISSSDYFANKFPKNVRILPKGILNFVSLLRFAANSELLVCGGGGLFQDDDSRVKMPYWGLKLVLFRLFCRRISGYSIGVGPLKYSLSQSFARLAFSCMQNVSVRDSNALNCCQHLANKPIVLLPDPALVLKSVSCETAQKYLSSNGIPSGRLLLGVTIRRWFHHVEGTWIPHKYAMKYHLRSIPSSAEYGEMLALIAKTLDRVIDKTQCHIIFLPTYNTAHEADNLTCQAIRDGMKHDSQSSLLNIEDPNLYKGVTRELDGMFASRMHPLIFAASEGTPVLGMSYNQKFDGFFNLIDAEQSLIDIRGFVNDADVDSLCTKLCSLLEGTRSINTERIQELQTRIYEFNKNMIQSL